MLNPYSHSDQTMKDTSQGLAINQEMRSLRMEYDSLIQPKPVKTASPHTIVYTKPRKAETKNEPSAPSTPEVKATLELQGIMMHHFGLDCEELEDLVEPDFIFSSPIPREDDNFTPPLRTENPLNLDRCFGGSGVKMGAELGMFRFSPELYH